MRRVERELLEKIKANQYSAVAALKRSDWAALEALALHEYELLGALKAIWRQLDER